MRNMARRVKRMDARNKHKVMLYHSQFSKHTETID